MVVSFTASEWVIPSKFFKVVSASGDEIWLDLTRGGQHWMNKLKVSVMVVSPVQKWLKILQKRFTTIGNFQKGHGSPCTLTTQDLF